MIVRPWTLFRRFCEHFLKTNSPHPAHWQDFKDNYSAYFSAYPGSRLARPDERLRFYPVLGEATAQTEIDLYYFYQNAWAARMVSQVKPQSVVDVGSSTSFVGVLSQFVPTTFYDIRPIEVRLQGLTAEAGSIIDLPRQAESIEFLTSICVIEHIGLGRYGDPIHPDGHWLAAMELDRALAPGGHLALSLTAGPDCVAYNAHRIFEKERFLSLFPGYSLESEALFTPHPSPMADLASVEPGEFAVYAVLLKKPQPAHSLAALGLSRPLAEALLGQSEGGATIIGKGLWPMGKRLRDAGVSARLLDYDPLMRGIYASCRVPDELDVSVREAALSLPSHLEPDSPWPVFVLDPPDASPRACREWLAALVLEATARPDRACYVNLDSFLACLDAQTLEKLLHELAQAVFGTHSVFAAPGLAAFAPKR